MPPDVIKIPPNKLHKQAQELDLTGTKIATLIGANGCGKSAVLEAIFKERIKSDLPTICWSSGKNESFSEIFKPHFKKINRKFWGELKHAEKPSMTSFFFDDTWTRVIIFFAVVLKSNGQTFEYLQSHNYCMEQKHLTIKLNVNIAKKYWKLIQTALKKEETDPNHQSIRRSFYHTILERLATNIDASYNFDMNLKSNNYSITADMAKPIFGADKSEIFTFIAIANHFGLIKDKIDLQFWGKNGIELNDLSDGEYQLLATYAVLDLFDAPDTLFLFDEIDAHLHFESIKKTWDILKIVKGHIITTTHTADSIIQNDLTSLKIVDGGKINSIFEASAIKRLQSLTPLHVYQKKLIAQNEYIVLIDDEIDWDIFKYLCDRKEIAGREKLNKVYCVKCNSGYESYSKTFGDRKLEWIDAFSEIPSNEINTKYAFLICDRDELPLPTLQEKMTIKHKNESYLEFEKSANPKGKVFLLSWRRRTIENYLISATMLKAFDLANKTTYFNDINQKLLQECQLTINVPMDCESIQVAKVKDIINKLYSDTDIDVCRSNLEKIISTIPPIEISNDIDEMCSFITGKMK